MVPVLQLGAFEIPQVPGVVGTELVKYESSLGVELDGMVGSRLLAAFRVTLTDGGAHVVARRCPNAAAAR